MRSTIELPDHLRQKLAAEAAARHVKGYSKIIAEALVEHFKTACHKKKDTIGKLRGCLSREDYNKERLRLAEGRTRWRE